MTANAEITYDLDAMTERARSQYVMATMPLELTKQNQWVCWMFVQRDGQPKPTKVPVSPLTGNPASATDPNTWGTFMDANRCFANDRSVAGIGFVFSAEDPYMGIDIDGAIDDSGNLTPLAKDVVMRMQSYTETSISGHGLHIVARGTMPDDGRGRKNTATGVEAYCKARYFVMTGQHFDGTPSTIEDRQAVLDTLLPELFPQRSAEPQVPPASTGNTVADDELLRKAGSAANGEKFKLLWAGQWKEAGYPSQSEADLALCQALVFWTNHDAERVDRLFRQSGLMRDKWNRDDYRRDTIDKAMQQPEGYQGNALDAQPFPTRALVRQQEPEDRTPVTVVEVEPDREQRMMQALKHLATLTHKYGPPFVQSGNGIVVNQSHMAAAFCINHLILYEPGIAEFYTYDAGRGLWCQQTEALLKTFVAAEIKTLSDATGVQGLAMKSGDPMLTSIVKLMRGYAERRDPFVRQGHVVHLQNGMLNIDARPPVLLPFAPEYYSRNQSPIAWDPEAQCPKFLNDLLGPVLAPEDIDILQRWSGMALLGHNPAQKLLILTGAGNEGKGTFANIVEHVVGLQNVRQLRTQFLSERFEIYAYVDRTLLCGKDVAGTFLNEKGAHVIKALVGNDMLDGEKKGGIPLQVRGDFNVLIATNSRLRVKLDGDLNAWRRRLMIIQYRQRPAGIKTVPNLDEILFREEGAGIVKWMVAGAQKLLAELEAHGVMQLSAAQTERVESLLGESDSVREFVRRCIAPANDSDVTTDEVVKSYTDFCDSRGWDALPVRQVETQLRDVMIEVHRAAKRNDIQRNGKSHKGYARLRIIEETQA